MKGNIWADKNISRCYEIPEVLHWEKQGEREREREREREHLNIIAFQQVFSGTPNLCTQRDVDTARE